MLNLTLYDELMATYSIKNVRKKKKYFQKKKIIMKNFSTMLYSQKSPYAYATLRSCEELSKKIKLFSLLLSVEKNFRLFSCFLRPFHLISLTINENNDLSAQKIQIGKIEKEKKSYFQIQLKWY